MIKKNLTFIIKIFGILFGILIILLFCFWIYADIFLAIDDNKAWNIAHNIIKEKYLDQCGGGFDENLSLEKYGYNALYEFYSDSENKKCSVLIFMGKFGEYDSWIGVN